MEQLQSNEPPAVEPVDLPALELRLARLRSLCEGLQQRGSELTERERVLAQREEEVRRLGQRLRELQGVLAEIRGQSEPVPESAAAAQAQETPGASATTESLESVIRERDELKQRLQQQEELLRRAGLEIEWSLPAEPRRRRSR